ncbi:MAG TPA: hypothetical protein VFJ12_12645 [Segeticoccus sp.]|jgi:hypothetical protein|nr:hypothetical protein [Segeticoccus sp.]
MTRGQVTEILIHPVKGEPGRSLPEVQVERDGLAGDRRKKAPVHLVGAGERTPEIRANFVLDLAADELAGWVGERVHLGGTTLAVTGIPSGCPGVYAAVDEPGAVHLGDVAASVGPDETVVSGR